MFWLLLIQAADTAPSATPPHPANNPASWVSVADYPAEAVQKHQEGAVTFAVSVDSAGKVTNCKTTASSGSPALDAATCSLVSTRAQFTPARDESGKPVIGTYSSRIRWVYPTIAAAPPSSPSLPPIDLPSSAGQKTGAAQLWVGADGIVGKCEPLPSPYWNIMPLPDICAAYPAGSRYSAPTLLHGKPQKRKVQITITTSDTYVR
jgi:TonB family protein